MEFRGGDVLIRVTDPSRPRFRVEQSMPGWIGLYRIRKDGHRDRREHRFSASPSWFQLAGAVS
jgi:hypothetical protein